MIKYLFHLSDIHIRNGDLNYSRFNEYKIVFDNLFESMKSYNYDKDEFLIIITGDIFHNKNNIGNYGLMLYKILIENLTTKGVDTDSQSLGAFYVLGTLTLVNSEARNSLPWLYQSFLH